MIEVKNASRFYRGGEAEFLKHLDLSEEEDLEVLLYNAVEGESTTHQKRHQVTRNTS